MVMLLFDIGNVVVECEHAITYRRLQAYGARKDAVRFFFDDDSLDFARGKLSPERFYSRLDPRINVTFDQAKEAFQKHLYGVNLEVVDILERLRETLPREDLGFLTDCNVWQVERVEGPQGLIRLDYYSDIVFRSCQIGMIKDDESLFPYVAQQVRRSPSDILLIDDNPENNRMAERHGWQTLLYRYPEQLSRDLKQRGILKEE